MWWRLYKKKISKDTLDRRSSDGIEEQQILNLHWDTRVSFYMVSLALIMGFCNHSHKKIKFKSFNLILPTITGTEWEKVLLWFSNLSSLEKGGNMQNWYISNILPLYCLKISLSFFSKLMIYFIFHPLQLHILYLRFYINT